MSVPLAFMGGVFGIGVNRVLMALERLPVPPLDGGRVTSTAPPPRLGGARAHLEPHVLAILLVLLLCGALWQIVVRRPRHCSGPCPP